MHNGEVCFAHHPSRRVCSAWAPNMYKINALINIRCLCGNTHSGIMPCPQGRTVFGYQAVRAQVTCNILHRHTCGWKSCTTTLKGRFRNTLLHLQHIKRSEVCKGDCTLLPSLHISSRKPPLLPPSHGYKGENNCCFPIQSLCPNKG